MNLAKKTVQLQFLGTGASSGVPNLSCLFKSCPVCSEKINWRRNTSVLINNSILIDCGKTFFQSALSCFDKNTKLEALILSHGHADAILGLDSIRDLTKEVVPVYCDKDTYKVVSSTFPYLADPSLATGGGSVSNLHFKFFESSFEIGSSDFQSFLVEHGVNSDGSPFYSRGFRFENICYISDVSKIPEGSIIYLQNLDLLILDMLRMEGSYPSHFCFPEVLKVVEEFRPKRTILVGMNHRVDHHRDNYILQGYNLGIELGYDGMKLVI